MKTGRILFPRDAQAGGTWFAVHENGNTLVVLNGARVRHQPAPPYRKSRGLIVLELADSPDPRQSFLEMNLDGIEPFTLILAEGRRLHECRWDGTAKETLRIDASQPHIWSSVTLYDDAAIAARRAWFRAWMDENPDPSQQEILQFHQSAGDDDRYNGLLMDRDGRMLTVSISSLQSSPEAAIMRYLDMQGAGPTDAKNGAPAEERILFRNATMESV